MTGQRSRRWLGGGYRTAIAKAHLHLFGLIAPRGVLPFLYLLLPLIAVLSIPYGLFIKRPGRISGAFTAWFWGWSTLPTRFGARRRIRQFGSIAAAKGLVASRKQIRQKQSKQIIIGTALALMALGGILFNRYQLKKRLAEKEKLLAVRDVIAKDLHDEVGSALSSIKILSEVSQKNIDKDSKKTALLLEKIVEQSEKTQQGMSDIVWAVKPDNDKLEDILIRMREYINSVLEPKNISVYFKADDKTMHHAIGMQQRRDLLMIFKEAVNNIAKHAGANNVNISIGQAGNNINLLIKDDGIGFNPEKITSSSGLKNMKARAEKMGGHLSISSTQQKGSVIKLTLPVVKK